jgi:hypothetical protein
MTGLTLEPAFRKVKRVNLVNVFKMRARGWINTPLVHYPTQED